MFRHKWPAEAGSDPRLARYRAGVASIWSGDVLVGTLTTRVQQWRHSEGPFWRRRAVRYAEGLEWFVSYARRDPKDHPDGYDDGVIVNEDALAHEIQMLDDDRFVLPTGETTRLEWLDGDEATRIWTAIYG